MAMVCRLNHQTNSLKATPYSELLPSLRLRAVRAIRLFESDKHSNAAITPSGLYPDFRADFHDFVWGRSIEKNTPEREQRRHILGFEAEVAAHQIRRERDGELIARRKYFCMRPAS